MTRRINYEDDIFALSLIVRTLRDLARLAPDPELLGERVLSDIAFVDEAVGRLLALLRASPHLARRAEHLRELARLGRQLAVVLEELATGETALATSLAGRSEELAAAAVRHDRQADEIDAMLGDQGETPPEERQVVSPEELRILIAPSDDSP